MPRTILIHATGEERLAAQLRAVGDLCHGRPEHVVGLAVLPAAAMVPAGVPGASDVVALDSARRAFRAEAERMRRHFLDWARQHPGSAEWILGDAQRAGEIDVFSQHAHAADLVVVAPTHGWSRSGDCVADVGHLVTAAGRPVVVLPKAGGSERPLGRRVVVAWSGAREVARAVFDALPLLAEAEAVRIVCVGDGCGGTRPPAERLADVGAMLARHGVRARAEEIALADSDAGPALLAAAKAENADLLVMGYKGRWRLRELIAGSASRHVLRHAHLPVLMAH
jgi:nucleotide-binding universal stress UspA family protein